MIIIKLRQTLFLLTLCSLVVYGETITAAKENEKMSQVEYQQRLRAQTQYHQLLAEGDRAKKEGNNILAADYYEQAFQIAKGSSLEGVTRAELSRIYEQIGSYQKAFGQVEWILANANPESPLYPKYKETYARLLKKIEEQKSWEKEQHPIVPQFKESFDQVSHQEQRQVLEQLGGEGVLEEFKNAMVAEHSSDFAGAREIYEELLLKDSQVEKEMGRDAIPMLYVAIQRTSELLKDQKREKEALVWMKANLLDPKGEHHAALSKLMPQIVTHIQNRIAEYRL